jgi:hypothetical protein
LTEEKNQVQKQYEKVIQVKESSLVDMGRQNQEQGEYYRRVYKEVEEKLRNVQSRVVELEGSLEQKKNENEKLRRNGETLAK